jgi:hypothetical protein
MNATPVESTTLSTVAYDDSRNLLQLEFRSRAAYQYFDIPAAVHTGLLCASSKGSYFNQVIRGRFRYVRVSHAQAGPGGAALLPTGSR